MALVPMSGLPAMAASSSAAAASNDIQQRAGTNPLELLGALLKNSGLGGNVPMTTTQTAISQVQPLVPRTQANIQTSDREFATGSGNRRVAANNLFKNISSVVNNAVQQREAKKERGLYNDITRMFQAMEGLQQGQASQNDELVNHNKQIITDILGDPKKAKMIEKAFDINLLGDQKNPTENKALMRAYADWQRGGQKGPNPMQAQGEARYQQFQKAMPQVQGMNPAILAQLQLMKMSKDAGMITPEKQMEVYGRLAATQMMADAHRFASQMQYAGRIDAEVQRGIGELTKVLAQNAGKSDKESLDAQEKTIKNTHDILTKSLTAKQKAIDEIGTAIMPGARAKKAQLEKEADDLKKLLNQNESYQLWIQRQRMGGQGAGQSDSFTNNGANTGSTSDKKTSAPASTRSGETLGIPDQLFDEFYKQFWGGFFGGKTGNDDPYAGRETQ